MKKILVLTIMAISMSFTAFGQAKKMTVKDYFLAIPSEFIKAPASKRSAWIEQNSTSIGYLSYNIPVKELTGETGDGSVFGSIQVFKKKNGDVLLGMANNMCAEKQCIGLMRFLEYKKGKFTDVSEDYMIIPDNDEVIKILRDAPAFTKKDSLKDGVQVPLTLDFNGNDKTIQFTAGVEKKLDGGVVAKTYKWNGVAFVEFEYPMSPE